MSKRPKKKNKIKLTKKSKGKEVKKELIIKTKSDWIKKALVNKKTYEKKYNDSPIEKAQEIIQKSLILNKFLLKVWLMMEVFTYRNH